MIYRTLADIQQSDLNVDCGNGFSRRFLIEKDGMGFSLTDTLIEAGTVTAMHYDRHLEACYCIEGRGTVETVRDTYDLYPGSMYALDQHDKHVLSAETDLRLICVFNPPLTGQESHKNRDAVASGY
ncbi:MAG: ectoine synthase [Paracoccaceae bacterium]